MMRWNAYRTFRTGVLAGAAGGLAEIIWISVYAATSGISPANVAREITTAASVNALFSASPAVLGVITHMGLAVTLGIALAFAVQAISACLREDASAYAVAVPTLAVIWGSNFFILLPVISPGFVTLVPYSVSLLSKLLFGLAAAEILRRSMPKQKLATAF